MENRILVVDRFEEAFNGGADWDAVWCQDQKKKKEKIKYINERQDQRVSSGLGAVPRKLF